VPMTLRRRWPWVVPAGIAVGIVVAEVAGLFPELTRTPMLMPVLGAGSAAMHIAGRRAALAGTAVAVVPAVVVNLMQQGVAAPPTDTPIIVFLAAMGHGFGRLAREQLDRAA